MAQAPGDSQADSRLVRCESVDDRVQKCPANIRGGARLIRQLSQAGCVEGRSWGVDREGIWVAESCAAEFATGYGGSGLGSGYAQQVVRCESRAGRWNQCAAKTRDGMEMVRQLSKNACIRGQSWGWDDHGVWVSGGCRGEFRSLAAGAAVAGSNARRIKAVRCESKDAMPQQCQVDTGGGVRLLRQLSKAPCVEGRSWGFDRGGIWVERGCRAEFEIDYTGDDK